MARADADVQQVRERAAATAHGRTPARERTHNHGDPARTSSRWPQAPERPRGWNSRSWSAPRPRSPTSGSSSVAGPSWVSGSPPPRPAATTGSDLASRRPVSGPRAGLLGEIGDEFVVGLYDKIRATSGIGAAALTRRRCGGCQLELNQIELNRPPQPRPMRCFAPREECRRILVRTPESGALRGGRASGVPRDGTAARRAAHGIPCRHELCRRCQPCGCMPRSPVPSRASMPSGPRPSGPTWVPSRPPTPEVLLVEWLSYPDGQVNQGF